MLPDLTQAVFDDLKTCKGIDRFLLVGGTALSMRIGHRVSEDLDFQSMEELDPRLIHALMDCLRGKGRRVTEIPNEALFQEFEDTGFEAHYSQIQFSVDGVKVEFFHYIPNNTYSFNHGRIRHEPVEGVDTGLIRVAGLDTIFYLKCLLIPSRSKHRDLYDLVTILKMDQYSFQDMVDIIREQDIIHDVYVRQLLHRKPASDDPGVTIPGKKPPSYKELVKTLEGIISAWEIRQARRLAKPETSGNTH